MAKPAQRSGRLGAGMAAGAAEDAFAPLEALATPALVVRASGEVAFSNPAAQKLLGRSGAALQGQPLAALFPACAEGEPNRLLLAPLSRLAGERLRVRAVREDGGVLDLALELGVLAPATPEEGEAAEPGEPMLVVALLEEPPNRREAEAAQRWLVLEREFAETRAGELVAANRAFERERHQLKEAKRRLTVQRAVLDALTRSRDLDEAAPHILEAIGTTMGWDVGSLFTLDEETCQLRARHLWQAPGLEAGPFLERTRKMPYARGEGMVGRVYQVGEPAWVDDAPKQPLFRRGELAAREGLCGAVWFPVRHGNEVFGVFEFLRRDRAAPDEDTLQAVVALGSQIGQFAERVRAERALAEGQERLETTLRSIADAVIAFDLDGRVEFLNLAAEQLTGLGLAQARGEPLAAVAPLLVGDPPDRRPLAPGLAQLLRSEAERGRDGVDLPDGTLLLSPGDGRERIVAGTGSPLRSARGELQGFVLVARDVTRARRAERRRRLLAETSARLAGSLDSTATLGSVAQLVVGDLADWCIIELRDGDGPVRPLALAHADPAQTAPLWQLRRRFPPDPTEDRGGVGRVLQSGEPLLLPDLDDDGLRHLARDPDHRARLRALGLRSLIVVPLSARRRTLGALLLASSAPSRRFDAEDLATAEELARRIGLAVDNTRLFEETTSALRAREEFLSIASHELKTPLTSLHLQIQSLGRALRADPAAVSPERLCQKLASAERQSQRLGRLIQDLLDLSRFAAGRLRLELAPVDLAGVAEAAIAAQREAARRAGCEVRLQVTGDAVGRWDRGLLDLVVAHLLSNAIKYGAGKPIAVALVGCADRVALSVSDQGIGIAPEDRERIFARFERAVSSRHFGGLGVGLYIARCAVAALGGTLGVESQPGRGSTFRAQLPRGGPAGEDDAESPRSAPGR